MGFTLDVYSNILPSMQEVAGQAIEAALGGAISPALSLRRQTDGKSAPMNKTH